MNLDSSLGVPRQHLPLHLGGIHALDPRKLGQPGTTPTLTATLLRRREPRVSLPLQTPLRNLTINVDILDQRLETDIVELWPDKPQHQQVEGRAVEVAREVVQDVDLDAAYGVFVVGVVADAED